MCVVFYNQKVKDCGVFLKKPEIKNYKLKIWTEHLWSLIACGGGGYFLKDHLDFLSG